MQTVDVFYHLIYEHSRGLRNLALHTAPASKQDDIEADLQHEGVDYLVCPVGQDKINVFFGKQACVDVVRGFGSCSLADLTPEQDFMLGIMLGYNRARQCKRYLERNQRAHAPSLDVITKRSPALSA